jgi:cell division protease FtsH
VKTAPVSATKTDPVSVSGPVPGRLSLVGVDVARNRELVRQKRLLRVAAGLMLVAIYLWVRLLSGNPVGRPHLPVMDSSTKFLFGYLFVILGASVLAVVIPLLLVGRSPHVLFRPEQIEVGLADVVGIDVVKDEVVRTLQLFLDHERFTKTMGGRARRGILFQGGPGTGKTLTAKAMAAEAGVPFLFASGTSFHSSYQGATQRKVRKYFKALRKAARKEGGAIGFIDEFDGIGGARSGMAPAGFSALPAHAGCGGLEGLPDMGAHQREEMTTSFSGGDLSMAVNELLVQMQSFDEPTGSEKLRGWFIDKINLFLPAGRTLSRPSYKMPNILLVASTNRADGLDPALLRPGRFDRALSFELPTKAGRRQLVDYFLAKKAHSAELDDDERRDAFAAITNGYSPAMIEGLLDEALISAVRRQADEMTWSDIERARLVTEVGLGQPVDYTDHERRLIATHEAGHAAVAWLVAPQRRLEVLTIIKRAGSLGLLAHGDREDVWTRSRKELESMIQIAFGGQVAEELFFGDVSTGPAGDLSYATTVAVQMVGAAGMTDSLVSFAAVRGSSFSDTNLTGRVLGDSAARELVEESLTRQKAIVRGLLGANRHLVMALRDALIERHELVGHEITDVLASAREAHQALATVRPVVHLAGDADPAVALAPEPAVTLATEPDQRSADVIDLRESQPDRT